MTQRKQESLETLADSYNYKRPPCLRVSEVHRAPNECDDLPDELPDASVGWTENPERAQ